MMIARLRPQHLRTGARMLVGCTVLCAACFAVILLGSTTTPLPAIDRGVVSVTVATDQHAKISLVCPGAFAELGVDPAQPTIAIPHGDTQLTVTNALQPYSVRELTRDHQTGSVPRVIESAITTPAAVELQRVTTPTLQGLSAASCAEAAHTQWLVGGSTTLGQSVTVILGNPYGVPAIVQLSVYDENGQLDSTHTAGVLVPAQAQRVISLGAYAPIRERLAVHVESTGAAVTAALGISHTVDIRSYAVDTVTRQLAPDTTLLIPAVTNVRVVDETAGSVSDGADIPVLVRLLAPGTQPGVAEVRALLPNGQQLELGTVALEPGAVTDLVVAQWPAEAQAVTVHANVPVLGAVRGSSDIAPNHDDAWFTPAPLIAADTETTIAVVPGGELVLVNPAASEAVVTVTADPRDEQTAIEQHTVVLAAGAAAPVTIDGVTRIHSTLPIAAGVRIIEGPQIAAYPVLPPVERSTSLTVFPR